MYHYTTDGVSGTTFDRKGFQKMIKAVEENKVSTLIVKDMSGFGKDYLKVGFYTKILFREKLVRFITTNNGIDSEKLEERKKRYKMIYEKGSIFTESKNLTKDEFYQLITSQVNKYEINLKILEIIENR
ncbi:recombinase family protein [Clostridium perfringens]